MAELAHETPDPASPEPAGIALQLASRPDSPDRGKLRVFISYSREDLDFADQLDAALTLYGFECLIDRHGISGGEDWKRRLGNLIIEADTVVFVLSPSSAHSDICAWEVEEAARLNKRILPIIFRALEGASPPPRLQSLNYIFFHAESKAPGSGFGTGLAKLIAALNTNFDWLREHTRYLQRAIEWDTGGRAANRLFSGDDIAEAKAWAARRPKDAPEPTSLQLDFIRASEEEAQARLSEQRRQLEEAQALRKRADELLARSTTIIANLYERMGVETKREAFALFEAGAKHGSATSMIGLGFLYLRGDVVPQDFAKAREWYEKAAAQDAGAKFVLEHLPVQEAEAAGRYAEALQRQEALAAKFEAEETKRQGKPGWQTASELTHLTRYALLAKDFTKALAVADRAHTLLPGSFDIQINWAHALMFMGHDEEAQALYLRHKGEPVPLENNKSWEQTIADHFAAFRRAGLTHPMMTDIENALGVSR
jgi:tetratricopeptide (TPR) repeat protein